MHAALAAALLALPLAAPASAAVLSFDDRAAFLAAAGPVVTLDFTAQTAGAVVGGTYAGQGASFSGATFADDAGFSDGEGITGGTGIEIVFDRVLTAIGFDYLGAITIVLYDAFGEVGRSEEFGGEDGEGFGGVTAEEEAVQRVVIVQWYDEGSVDVDNQRFAVAEAPLPPAGLALGAGLLALGALRRRG